MLKLPKSGYINADAFDSPRSLANYLKYLDSNKTAYNEYFKWKKYIRFDSLEYPRQPICDLCVYLHLEDYYGVKQSIIKNIGSFWNLKSNCKSVNIINETLILNEIL